MHWINWAFLDWNCESGFSNFPRFSFHLFEIYFWWDLSKEIQKKFQSNSETSYFIVSSENHWEIQFKNFKIFYKSWLFLVYLTTSLKIPMQTDKKSQNSKFRIFIESRKRDLFIVLILIIHRRCSNKTKGILWLEKLLLQGRKFLIQTKTFPTYVTNICLGFRCSFFVSSNCFPWISQWASFVIYI
jgi:hypothetical protein